MYCFSPFSLRLPPVPSAPPTRSLPSRLQHLNHPHPCHRYQHLNHPLTFFHFTTMMTPLSQSVVPKQGSPHSPPQALLSPASLSPTSLPGSPHQGSPHHPENIKRPPSSPQHQQSHQNHLESPKRHQGSHPGLRNIENLVNGISNGVKEGSKFEQVRHLEPAPARTLNT